MSPLTTGDQWGHPRHKRSTEGGQTERKQGDLRTPESLGRVQLSDVLFRVHREWLIHARVMGRVGVAKPADDDAEGRDARQGRRE